MDAAEVPVSLEVRIFQARRSGCRTVLMGGGVPADEADRWCDAWETEATKRGIGGSGTFWDDGRRWIDQQRLVKKAPPDVAARLR